jgi:hypothetical protein
MQQRLGRVARIGSRRHTVHSYLIEPPRSAERLLESESIITRKRSLEENLVESPAEQIETLRSVLAGWLKKSRANRTGAPRCQPPDATTSHSTDGDRELLPRRGCVVSDQPGFLALALIGGHARLVVNLNGRTSTDIGDQIEACRLATGADISDTSEDYSRALEQLESWFDNDTASTLAGAAGSSSVRRKRLLNRIDREMELAPPHSRAKRIALAADARRIVAGQHSGAIESDLDELAHSELESEEWLSAITRLDPDLAPTKPQTHRWSVQVLLLLRPAKE